MKIKVTTTAAERKSGLFCDVISWRFTLTTGSRCSGLSSERTYKTQCRAYEAGERMVKKLNER